MPGSPWLAARGEREYPTFSCLRGFGFDDEVSGSGASEFRRIGYGGSCAHGSS
jgi:hypothetical protein